MRDFIELGPTPSSEPCAQVGEDEYDLNARIECQRYKDMLASKWPDAHFAVKGFPHDFGRYFEVVVYIDEDNPDLAFEIDRNLPSFWTWNETVS